MRRRKAVKTVTLPMMMAPMMMAELTFASFEVIARRMHMMASGSCSVAEYHRMVHEKASAGTATALRLAAGGSTTSAAALLAPWHACATANARRLRRR